MVVDFSTANLIVLDLNGVGYTVETTKPTHAILSQERQLVNLHIQTMGF